MSEAPKHTRLFKRGGVYWFRATVPKDLAERFCRREIRYSLQTKDPAVALEKGKAAALKTAELFAKQRRLLAGE